MIRFPAAQCRPVPGPVKVVPPRRAFRPGLRGLHLDSACAPAVTWQLTGSGTGKISPIKVSTLSGEPRWRPGQWGQMRMSREVQSADSARLMVVRSLSMATAPRLSGYGLVSRAESDQAGLVGDDSGLGARYRW